MREVDDETDLNVSNAILGRIPLLFTSLLVVFPTRRGRSRVKLPHGLVEKIGLKNWLTCSTSKMRLAW